MEWATTKVDGGAGVLHIVKNYSGDIMNFEMAADLGREAGVEVQSVVVDDDVAVKDSLYTQGRRGVGGTVLMEKIVGAKAEEGGDLQSVADLARDVNANVRSMGLALTSCTVPAAVAHLRAGRRRGRDRHRHPRRAGPRADQDGERRPAHRPADPAGHRGPGPQLRRPGAGVRQLHGRHPLAELYVIYRRVAQLLDEGGVQVARHLVGPYITSLEMQGASVTILRLDDEKTRLWDAPVHTPALRWGCSRCSTVAQAVAWVRSAAAVIDERRPP